MALCGMTAAKPAGTGASCGSTFGNRSSVKESRILYVCSPKSNGPSCSHSTVSVSRVLRCPNRRDSRLCRASRSTARSCLDTPCRAGIIPASSRNVFLRGFFKCVNQGRRASRLPLAFISRAVGAPYLISFFASCSRSAAEIATSKPFCAPPLRFFCSTLMYSVRCLESARICLRISARSASRF